VNDRGVLYAIMQGANHISIDMVESDRVDTGLIQIHFLAQLN
jgi:hypothetical protein